MNSTNAAGHAAGSNMFTGFPDFMCNVLAVLECSVAVPQALASASVIFCWLSAPIFMASLRKSTNAAPCCAFSAVRAMAAPAPSSVPFACTRRCSSLWMRLPASCTSSKFFWKTSMTSTGSWASSSCTPIRNSAGKSRGDADASACSVAASASSVASVSSAP